MQVLEEKHILCDRFVKATAHLGMREQLRILLGWIPLDNLEQCVELQEEHVREEHRKQIHKVAEEEQDKVEKESCRGVT